LAAPGTQTGLQVPQGRHVLVIKLGALGDVILALPHIERILEAHAADRVVLLTAPSFVELLAASPRLEVVAYPRRGTRAMSGVLSWLLRQSFDVVYDLQGSNRSRIMTRLTRAARRVGERPGFAYTHAAQPLAGPVHAVERLNALLAAGGIAPPAALPHLSVPESAMRKIDAWLQQEALQGRRLVLVHPGSSMRWPSKRWEERSYRELVRRLVERGLGVIWIGGVDESARVRRLASGCGINAAGLFTLSEIAGLGRHAAFAITNDSGPMHVLAAVGLPVYAFFGPTDWRRSHAPGQAGRVLTHPVECSPCHLGVCPPERGHACLSAVTPAQVMTRLEADGMLNQEK
jgi:ADP-heptose:LPS heptosyltransferase